MGKYQNAAIGMLNWLRANGIKGGPVSQPTKKDPVITCYSVSVSDQKRLPKEFDGFAVDATTKSPDYDRNQLHDMLPVESRHWKKH